ncbi:MAG: tRNA pseudouridine32 synthase/23S rRNA pseudouridine746 synthase [Flavobacteriales bacterium]|jgi:tRNA pseudouridine32 synthase/23S rRNA pseudouridine746 synthase
MKTLVDDFIAPPCKGDIEFIYQDEHILVINKPTQLLSLSGKNPLNKDSVHWRLVQQYPSAKLAHRIDFGTSGLMLVGLNDMAIAALCRQFSERLVDKQYVAVLDGIIDSDTGVISAPIAKDKESFPRQKICSQTGKPASSAYEVISRCESSSSTRVTFSPITGRTHQLRIHSYHIGHPILGCDIYNNVHSYERSERLMLHASFLSFQHPHTEQNMAFDSAAPF